MMRTALSAKVRWEIDMASGLTRAAVQTSKHSRFHCPTLSAGVPIRHMEHLTSGRCHISVDKQPSGVSADPGTQD